MKTNPVIITTAKAEVKDLCKWKGAEGYIVKSFPFKNIMAKIKEFLGENNGNKTGVTQENGV